MLIRKDERLGARGWFLAAERYSREVITENNKMAELKCSELVSADGEYESGTPTAEKKREKAEFLGLKMVTSNDMILLIDLDSDAHQEVFDRSYGILTEAPPKQRIIGNFICTTSRRGRKHAYVKLRKPLGIVERIGLQAVLGSDTKREALSLLELQKGYEEPTVLFETPAEYERAMSFIGEPKIEVN